MIGVSSSSRSFASLGRYLVAGRSGQEEGRIVWSAGRNLPTDDPELAAKIMRASAAENVRVKQPVYHLALSCDPTDVVDRAAMERVADRVLRELKLDEHQAVIVAHGDRQHPHVHILVNRVHPETGKVWDRWQDYPAIQRALRAEEQALGLRPVESSVQRATTRGEDRYAALRADLDALDRISEKTRQRYGADIDLAHAQARLVQVETVARRLEANKRQIDRHFRDAFCDPGLAKERFVAAARAHGDDEAVRRLRREPERYGDLQTTQESQRWGRRTETDSPAREAAVAAAGVAEGYLKSRREPEGLVSSQPVAIPGRAPEPDRQPAGMRTFQAAAEATLQEARNRVQQLGALDTALPSKETIEFRLRQGLRRLSPPEFEQLRFTLSPRQVVVAHKLRQMVRDAALGRDDADG